MQRGKLGSNKISKQIVQHVEVPLGVSEKRRSVKKHIINPLEEIDKKQQTQKTVNSKSSLKPSCTKNKRNSDNPLHAPKLNSVNQLIKNMDNLKIESNYTMANLTPKSKSIVSYEVSKKLNFPCDKAVFTNLVSIEIDDSDSIPDYAESNRKKRFIRDKYMKSEKKKDPVPELKDFLSPIKRIEIKVPLYTREINVKAQNPTPFRNVREIVSMHPSY